MSTGHRHADAEAGDRRVLLAIVVNVLLTAAQIVGGVLAGSLALIADAIHNLSDALSLVIAFAARKVARRPSDPSMTFGYARIEVVAALVNYTILIVIGVYLVYEAFMRFVAPHEVDGWLVVIVAAAALLVDTATVFLTYTLSKESVNIRAAFVHSVADALGSLAVIVAGTLILLYDWRLADPLVTILIAGYILWHSFYGIGPVIRILMLASPPEIPTEEVVARLASVEGVESVHHAHFWQMEERRNALDAHIVVEDGAWGKADAIKARAKAMLLKEFGIDHTTLEMECARHACQDARTIGHHDSHGHARAHDGGHGEPAGKR